MGILGVFPSAQLTQVRLRNRGNQSFSSIREEIQARVREIFRLLPTFAR